MNALSVLENLLAVLGIAGFFIAPIAWVVFIVFCFRSFLIFKLQFENLQNS